MNLLKPCCRLRRLRGLAALAPLMCATLGVMGVGTAGAVGPATPTPVPVAEYAAVGASSTPKQVTLDAHTGAILSMSLLPRAIASPQIDLHTVCQAGDACWWANSVPYPSLGWSGTGTSTGSWPGRQYMRTNSHSTSICWTDGSTSPCSPEFGPNTIIGTNQVPVTGTKVVNYS